MEYSNMFSMALQYLCSSETTMISTPRYDSKMKKALSLGWLTVRQVGFTYLRLKCHIQICHVCDDECTLLTPPINCTDYSNSTIIIDRMHKFRKQYPRSHGVFQQTSVLSLFKENVLIFLSFSPGKFL
ncbi:hypothetical protein QQG55_2955 [Brugia pahangi]